MRIRSLDPHFVKFTQLYDIAFARASQQPSGQLALLSFIPGVGEKSDLVIGGLDIFGAISKIIDIASLARTLDEETDIFSLLGTLGDDAEIAEAAAGVEDALDVATLVTRGKFGQALSKVTDKLVQCAESNMEGLVMDGLDLGTSVAMSKRPRVRII
ncbi:hypothetical protein B0H13DRAFT_2652018 [Mycena leptocephala]|nr:hypothetical protein B0H13DRAFT_2652018 [Mycena leptocephala]